MHRDTKKSRELYRKAIQLMPGGVNSPVRAFKSVGGNPLFIKNGAGCRIYDVDGNEYIDMVGSWGPLILGHARIEIVEALHDALCNGMSFGAPTEAEIQLAELVTGMVPSMEMVRMVNSGTEATMSAVRVARGYTKRPKIIKFEGCYHGHGDFFLSKAGSGALTLGIPDSAGVTPEAARDTLNAAFNDIDSVAKLIAENEGAVAAVIVEPVAANMGCVLPVDGFLEGLRRLCTDHGILLIFDEVITGFRLGPGGAQERFGIMPDLTTLGKIIGGGLPVGAYGGRKEIMECVAPLGPVYQAGTLSGNPLAMTAGYETLKILNEKGIYEELEKKGKMLEEGLNSIVTRLGIPVSSNRIASLGCSYFTEGPVIDFASAKTSDVEKFNTYFWTMLEEGIYIAPSQFEAMFISDAHTDADIDKFLAAAEKGLKKAFARS